MLTILSVETPQPSTKLDKILYKLRKDKIETYYRSLGLVKLKCVDYTLYSKQINYKKLDKVIGAQRNRLICNKEVVLPKHLGYKRFENSEYKERLCKNLCIELVSKINKNIKVGVIDFDATHTQLVKYLTKYTDCVTVVTKQIEIYKEVADNLLEETGAPIYISKGNKSLTRCELVVALSGDFENVCLQQSAILLCIQKPESDVHCLCIYDYIVELPKQVDALCPEDMDKTYFASALYSMCNVYQLGSAVPRQCQSDIGLHTVDSLMILIENMNTKT